jgi:hypothetical protein
MERKSSKMQRMLLNNFLKPDVIRRFINRSWRFMSASAYRKCSGIIAGMGVKKQKQHPQVSQQAMMSIEAVLNHSDEILDPARP